MIKNENMLYLITKMDEKYQIEIKEHLEMQANFSVHDNGGTGGGGG
jgi:hypothetical protein